MMSSDTADLPPFSQEIEDGVAVSREREGLARSGVVADGLFDVTLPPRPGSREARLSLVGDSVRVGRDVFDAAVSAAWVLWLRGEPVTVGDILRVAESAFVGVDVEVLGSVVGSEKFRLALLSRGVELGRVDADGLSAEMVACVRALSDPQPGLTVRERLKGVGVSWEQYQGWLGFGPFREALTRASERGLRGAVALANSKLLEGVDSGDLRSVKYLHELTGYFTPGRQQVLDVQQLVRDVMTVVLRRVTDPELLLELAGDFRVLQERMLVGGDGSGSGERGAVVAGFGEVPAIIEVPMIDVPVIESEAE
jgi:hypothetical protein